MRTRVLRVGSDVWRVEREEPSDVISLHTPYAFTLRGPHDRWFQISFPTEPTDEDFRDAVSVLLTAVELPE